ncbi:MAG: RIP metalloprotease RseP [Bacteroidales bacterium]|nr:RIP metalloprotease RseP [Bacteroidales bacterium]
MDLLVTVLQFLLSLSILIVTHEGGHFFFAKLFGIRVEKFYLFFDPWFELFKYKKGETEYGIGWLPLGGYVKISGMVDESLDMEQMKQPVQEWEFRAKPAWQRLLVMLGGVLVNFIEAPLIFWLMLYTWGETYVPLSEAKYGFEYSKPLQDAGLRDGDMIVGVNGVMTDKYKDVVNAIIFEDPCVLNVLRDGERKDIELPHEFFREILKGYNNEALLSFRIPAVIDSVIPNGYAAKAGLAKGDSIISVGGVPTPTFSTFTHTLGNLKNHEVDVVVARNAGTIDTLKAKIGEDGKLGIYAAQATRWIKPKHVEYGFFAAFPAGVSKGWETLVYYVRQLPMVFTKEGATKIGGFGTIAGMFPSRWDWQAFWFNTAFLAVILAFMNVLPIPALDGGHVLFLLVEIVTGRKLSDRALEIAQNIGMAILFALLIYANGADIVRAFFK